MSQYRQEFIFALVRFAQRFLALAQGSVEAELFHGEPGALGDGFGQRNLTFAPTARFLGRDNQ